MRVQGSPKELSHPLIVESGDYRYVKRSPARSSHLSTLAKLSVGVSALIFMACVVSSVYSKPSFLSLSADSEMLIAQTKFLSNFSRVAEFKDSRANGPVVISKMNQFLGYSTVEGNVEVWNIETLSQVGVFNYGKSLKISAIAFSVDNKNVLAAGESGHVKVWSIQDKTEIANFWNPGPVKSLAVSSSDELILAQTGESVRVWHLPTRKLGYEFKLGDTTISEMALSKDNKYFVASNTKGHIRVWNFKTGVTVATFNHGGRFSGLKLSDDNKHVISAGFGHSVNVWSIETKEKVAQTQHQDFPFATAISSESKYVLSGGRSSVVKVMDLKTGVVVAELAHDSQLASVVVTKDSKFAISGDHSGVMKMWNIDTKMEVGRYDLGAWIESIVMSEDEKYVAAASLNGSVYLWTL